MKTRIILSFIAAMLLQFTTVKADTFTDGLMKLMNSEALAAFSSKTFEQTAQVPGVNADYFKNDFKKDAVEWLAPHYRQAMSEKEFNELIEFYLQPEILSIQKKVLASASGDNQAIMQQLMPQMQGLMMGGSMEDLKMPDCDPQLLKEVMHWLEINQSSECSKAALSSTKQMVLKMAPDNIPAEQQEMMTNMMNKLFSFMENNMTTLTATMMINSKVDIKDLQTLNSVENKPFFANFQKANTSVAKDMTTFMNIMTEKMFKK